jgi:diadenylate cyclase
VSVVLDWWRESPFATATWVDWLDMAILAWLVYRVLVLLRGTRAMQILLGIALLAVVWLGAEWLQFSAIGWVLDNVFLYALIATIILFQEDIRRALARAGGTVFTGASRGSDANVLEEVTQACFVLAQRRIGAIVAIERGASLVPYIEGARRLDARVSSELLQAIFHPSSPMHDGAVVVQGDRLLAAGAFFPIALSADVARMYGTRHRAAIGLTEDVDAVVLVVSEERGTVSLVKGGQVTPVVDANDLRTRLTEGLERDGKRDEIERQPAPA